MSPHDWPVVDGHFVPANMRATSILMHRRKRRARIGAQLLRVVLPEIESIHLFGSCVECSAASPPNDIDLLLVLRDGAERIGIKQRAERILAGVPDLGGDHIVPPWDVSVRRRHELDADPFLKLIIGMRALRLEGDAIWSEPPRVPADRSTAILLWPDKRREIGAMFRELQLFLANDGLAIHQASVARRIQKRVLRLGMLDALARFGVFAVEPSRCAELATHAHPMLARHIQVVARDLALGDDSIESIDRAVDLCAKLLVTTDLNQAASRAA